MGLEGADTSDNRIAKSNAGPYLGSAGIDNSSQARSVALSQHQREKLWIVEDNDRH